MTKDTPKWPGEMPTEGMRIDVERENKTWNQSRAACIAAFEEWRKGRVELEELDDEKLTNLMVEVNERNEFIPQGHLAHPHMFIVFAKAICKRFGVRRELGELDEGKLKLFLGKILLQNPFGDMRFANDDIDSVCAIDQLAKAICQRFVVRKVPTVEEIKKTMIRAKHGDAAFTTTKYKMDVLRKQAEAVHKLITEGGEG